MPDDDWALSQGTVDERNEARNPLNAMESLNRARRAQELHERRIDVQLRFACKDPEQSWIEDMRREAERKP